VYSTREQELPKKMCRRQSQSTREVLDLGVVSADAVSYSTDKLTCARVQGSGFQVQGVVLLLSSSCAVSGRLLNISAQLN
jgi:hypothetical protein